MEIFYKYTAFIKVPKRLKKLYVKYILSIKAYFLISELSIVATNKERVYSYIQSIELFNKHF